ncbi:uncharacterized protein LOC141601518 isoform X2 [Silene latifolia]|uniref:uncharacterized protein LOC141601518 isoform X2 n=1 Tax=Silene latifolia TaxID=37657 RepID=UPI003D77371D
MSLNTLKPCEICGDIGYQPISICCRCRITREHPYCMKIMHYGNPKDWVCEECELGDQRRACSSKPSISKLGDHARACSSKPGISELRDQTRACSSKPGPSKEPNNTTTRGKIMKPPRSKVQYLPPEDAKRLKSGALKKNVASQSKLNLSCRPTVNRTPPPKPEAIKCSTVNRTSPLKSDAIRCSTMNRAPPKFSVKPNTPDKPPAIKLQSPSHLPNSQQDKKWSSSKDTEKHVAKKQRVRQDSPLAIRSAKEAQTSNATEEERRAAQPFWRNPSASKPSPGKNIKPNAERDNNNPGQISRQLVQDLRPVRSDKGPSRQLYRDNFAGMPVPCEKVQCNTERVIKNAGHGSMQHVRHSIATSSGKESLEHGLELDRYLPNHPAEFPTWEGRFNISIDDADLCRSIDGIRAHPSCKVQRKAYDLSRKLPEVLEFELLPRLNIWGNLFDYSVPDSRDIGLYFLSPKISTLLDYMYEHNMLLRCQIDGVELLVFSSQHLAECSQTINKKFFLWGLFRPLEDNTEALGRLLKLPKDGNAGSTVVPKAPNNANADPTVQTVRESSRDANPEPTVQAVPKRVRNTNRGPAVQEVQKPAKDVILDTTMLHRVQKSAKDAYPGPTVDKLTPVKHERLDRDQPLATSYLQDESESDRDLEQLGQVKVKKVQAVPNSSKDINLDPTVKAVPKRARNTNQGPILQPIQKPAKDANPGPTMVQAVPKPAKDANRGPTVEKLTPAKQVSLDKDQPLATSYLQDESEFKRCFDKFVMLAQPEHVKVKEEGGSPGR